VRSVHDLRSVVRLFSAAGATENKRVPFAKLHEIPQKTARPVTSPAIDEPPVLAGGLYCPPI
jgi:hypothetical protein